ncbi:MAG: 1-deoxy-D-xylulose-5-phosphate synthase [bacterium]
MFDLNKITDPSFVKELSIKELKILSNDIRNFLIDNVSKTGGHLASNLGVVEITIALHYVFDSPNDKLLFDVGHQSYVHKILTGRASEFNSLRKFDGLSGYIKRDESIHDCFESGHSSTSIATGLGMLYAEESDRSVVSIIGDSAIANGVALEALNITHETNTNPIVILNDNKMGIGKSVGALNKNLSKIRGTKFWRGIKTFFRFILPSFLITFLHKIKRGIKGFLQADNIFEDMGYDYFGPYNGNNIKDVIAAMQRAKKIKKPVLIHLITEKGKGYTLAEDDENGDFHGVPSFDPVLGVDKTKIDNSFSEAFALSLIEIRKYYEFKVINPAMISGTKLDLFQDIYPNDIIDVGIAEELAVSMSTGLALEGKDVVVSMYSTFAQRAYDYFLNDVARQNLKVLVCLDRAGIVGADGSTHQGVYDVSMFNSMPNFKIAMPMNKSEMYGLMKYYFIQSNPMVIRYPKAFCSEGNSKDITDTSWYYLLNNNSKTAVISYGYDLERINKIVKENNFNVDIINALFIKPLDLKMIREMNKYDNILIYEQVVRNNSLGSNIIYELNQLNYQINIKHMCFNVDDFLVHGDIESVLDKYNLSDKHILKEIKILCD